jgi:hypothetical protein
MSDDDMARSLLAVIVLTGLLGGGLVVLSWIMRDCEARVDVLEEDVAFLKTAARLADQGVTDD